MLVRFKSSRTAALTLLVVATLVVVMTAPPVAAGQAPTAAATNSVPAQQLDTTDEELGALTITNVTVSQEQPVAGDTFEVRLTVRNHEGAGTPVELKKVSLNGPNKDRSVSDPGTLPEGASTTVTFPVTVDSPGQYSLDATVRGVAPGEGFATANRPVPVRVVENQGPQLNLIAPDLETGVESTAEVTVTSGNYQSVQSLELTVDGEQVRVQNPRRIRTELSGQAKANYTFDLVPTAADSTDLTAELSYTTPSGERKTVTSVRTVTIEEPDQPVSLAVSGDTVGPSGQTDLELTVANEGDKPVSGLEFQLDGRDIQLVDTRYVTATLPAGNETTYIVEARGVDPGSYPLRAVGTYRTDGDTQHEFEQTVTATVTERRNPGQVNITGLRVSPGSTGLEVRGTASNSGSTNVTGVTIRVGQSQTVAPAQTQSSFFVGNIQAGEFSSFDVNAVPQANGSVTIPLEVSYVVDGVQKQQTIELDYQGPTRPQPSQPQQSGGGLPLVLVGGVVVVGGALVAVWRRVR